MGLVQRFTEDALRAILVGQAALRHPPVWLLDGAAFLVPVVAWAPLYRPAVLRYLPGSPAGMASSGWALPAALLLALAAAPVLGAVLAVPVLLFSRSDRLKSAAVSLVSGLVLSACLGWQLR